MNQRGKFEFQSDLRGEGAHLWHLENLHISDTIYNLPPNLWYNTSAVILLYFMSIIWTF